MIHKSPSCVFIRKFPQCDYPTADSISSMKFISEELNTCCTICLEELNSYWFVTKLPCKHSFHSCCICTWLSDHITCPVCRMEINHPLKDSRIILWMLFNVALFAFVMSILTWMINHRKSLSEGCGDPKRFLGIIPFCVNINSAYVNVVPATLKQHHIAMTRSQQCVSICVNRRFETKAKTKNQLTYLLSLIYKFRMSQDMNSVS
uniref:RING-type domain-containing protein n=1 Tax=Strigamia maritima TaxID=126957 RepID=T1IXZ0_STRMM